MCRRCSLQTLQDDLAQLATVCVQITAHAKLSGQPLPVMDALIMATAQCHSLTFFTRNLQDFAPYPQIFNPWAL